MFKKEREKPLCRLLSLCKAKFYSYIELGVLAFELTEIRSERGFTQTRTLTSTGNDKQ